MNRLILNGAVIAAMAVAMTLQAESALACLPFGGGDTGARGGGDKGGQLMSDGANVAYYEWSESHQAFVLVSRWYEPGASSLPIAPDEVDATEIFYPETLFDCGGTGWQPGDKTLPVVPVTATVPRAIRPGLMSFMARAINFAAGSGRPGAVVRPIVQVAPREIEAPDAQCSAVDPTTRQLQAQAIIQADRPGELCANCRYTIIYAGGERHDWYRDSLMGPVWPDGDRGCY